MFDVGTVTGAPVLGALVSQVGYPAMFQVAAVAVALGVVAFALWDRDPRLPRRV